MQPPTDIGPAGLAGLAFAFPWALLLLVGAVLLLRFRQRTWWLRLLAFLAFVLALAQPWIPVPGGHLAVVVDVSDSVGGRGLELARATDLGALRGSAEVVLAAGDALRAAELPGSVPTALDTSATDLSRALQVAVANGAGRILLVSDGVTPSERLLTTLPGVPVDVVTVPGVADVRVQELILPSQAAPGQVVEGVAVLMADRATTAQLHLEVDGGAAPPQELELREGETAVPFTFTVGERGSTGVRVSLTLPFEQPTGNDHGAGEVAVRARPPVLVVGDPAFAELLRVQGIDVIEGGPEAVTVPLSYGAVVVRGSSSQFTGGQLDLLRSYVDGGGGLLMTGGPDSFGFGAWYRTAVEDVLPVTTDLRTEVALPLVALVMVIDRSQSMASGRPAKIELAKEGALQVVELAYQDDLLGLIAFSDGPGTRWVFELRPASERGKREMAQGILSLGTSGGTVLEPAYRQALEALTATEAAVKHVIVLSDGQLYDGSAPFGGQASTPADLAGMASGALAQGITTSTIAIGEAADFERLEAIADSGGGRYYAALDTGTLPRIFTNEALTATRALLVEEPTAPRARPNPLYSFPETLPTVDAYVATSLKGDAQELLGGRGGEPLLATRRAGLGRTAALTTDLNGWAGDFGAWPELPGALATLTRWLQARPPGWTATAERVGNELLVTLDAVENGDYVNNARIEARHAGASAPLEQVAPGRYRARLPWSAAGGSEVVLASEGEVVARARVTGPDPEYADVDGPALLASVAERTGGRVVSPEEPYTAALATVERHLWPWLALAGLGLFMLELVWRRRVG